MWNRVELKMRGSRAFRNNYWSCVGAAFVMAIVAGGFGGVAGVSRSRQFRFESSYNDGINAWRHTKIYRPDFPVFGALFGSVIVMLAVLGVLVRIFVGNMIEVGGARFFVLNQVERPSVGRILDGFRSGHYGNIVLSLFLRDLYISLWSLLLVIPGIIKYYEYLMVPYILADNPGMNRREAFLISKRMMTDQKMEAFIMSLSFIGWDLLSLVSCGLVGAFYVGPYRQASFAEMYTFNKGKAYHEGYIRS